MRRLRPCTVKKNPKGFVVRRFIAVFHQIALTLRQLSKTELRLRTPKPFGLLLLLLVACSTGNQVEDLASSWQQIDGRDDQSKTGHIVRRPVYRARVPKDWVREDPSPGVSNEDSKLPICTFVIDDDDEQIRITIHNFPTDSFDQRIPAQAQVARWKRQLGALDEGPSLLTPVAHGGFSGLYLQVTGERDGQPTRFLAWSMLLDPEHYRVLVALEGADEELRFFRQMRADYTIKAVGSPDLVEQHREAIESFARSFELIEAIPSRQ